MSITKNPQRTDNITQEEAGLRRCVIVCGGPIGDYAQVSTALRDDDYFIFCDCGLKHLQKLQSHVAANQTGGQLLPDLIVGDFDSYENPVERGTLIETMVLPCEKDETDSAFAAAEAIRRGFRDVLIIGAVGGRMDHTLVNLTLLLKLSRAHCHAVLLDDYSEMEIITKEPAYIDGSFPYFSLLNLFDSAHDITITGAKYNVSGAEIKVTDQYATSNEVAPGERACVTLGEGELLLIKVRRDMSNA